MYVNGLSSYHIADRFGICKKAVLERLRNMGVEIRTRGRPMTVDSEVREKALDMREQGASWKEIMPSLAYPRVIYSRLPGMLVSAVVTNAFDHVDITIIYGYYCRTQTGDSCNE